MLHDYKLNDFIEYPNLALSFAMATPYQWSGAPKYRYDSITNLIKRCGFLFGALNLIYQNFGLVFYLFINEDKKSDVEAQTEDNLGFLGQIAETGAIMGLTLVGACKMWMIYSNKQRIRALLEEFEEIFPNSKNHEDFKFYRVGHFARQSQQLMKCTMIFFVFAFVYYNSLPLVELAYELFMPDQQFQYHAQSNTWYPWQNRSNRKSIVSFVACYFCQVLSSLTGVAFIMGGEFLLCFFITQMQMHFEYLANALEACNAAAPSANQRLKFLLSYHGRLQRNAKEINIIFNITFFVNFVTSAISICLMGLSMVLISMIHALKYSVGLMAFLVFTLFICYNGSEFTEASNKLMPAAFYSNWYEGNRAYQKMILFFIMRTEEPNYLRAYKFSTVSMETYMAILKISYRLFAFLRAMG